MRGMLAPPARVDRRLERLSGQHPPSVPRESQAHGGGGTSLLAGLASVAHWHGDQANGEKTGRRDHATDGSWSAVASRVVVAGFARRDSPQHAFIERLNATFRQRKARLTRRSRHAAHRLKALETGMYLIGCSYNFCCAHHELSKATHWGRACTPAMASGLTDHVWRVGELLIYKVAPPPWVESAQEGPLRKRPVSDPEPTRRARVRLRKGVLCSVTR